MPTLLLLACLAGAPAECVEIAAGAHPTEAACQQAGRAAALPDREVHAWTCDPAFWVAEVAPGVFVHKGQHAEPLPENGADTANIGYVIGTEAVAVIDAGGSDAVAAALLADIRRRTDLPVRWLVLTHMHPDHVLGAGTFAEAGAEILGHPELPAALAARHGHYHAAYAREMGAGWHASTDLPEIQPAPPEIDLGGRRLILAAHPAGHTTNDLTARDTRTDTLFVGDIVFLHHMPAIDATLRGWQTALADLADTPAARIVPGHGPVSAPWPEAAAPTLGYLERLAAEVRQAIDDGYEMIETVTQISVWPNEDWLLGATFHPRNVTKAYRELEWE